ncbi:hypothetical protein M2132_001008 [Dysgonomonas sp. PH5-45]|uniref:hypothetical protein n=1 Tax=unclassified Dysgonomonas TaxID=2630389 RepID=UPI002474B9EB|nr:MULTISPECIES: hypothetical protein [unclassified Dysgonomonas]MDH6354679.1 hypothetical protein [Dysgonomonas sp. PH5-45]MDH6387576.1 hypothetical protein [Dysgonomonas sp. PH5-37]
MGKTAIERLIDFIDYLKSDRRGGRTNFERTVGISEGYITNALKKKASIGTEVISKIGVAYPELNVNWLLTGEGQMLKTKDNNRSEQAIEKYIQEIEALKIRINDLEKIIETQDTLISMLSKK